MTEPSSFSIGRIFVFWFPMAGTWLMMALEAPFLAAVIARLAEPKENLAAFGVAYAVAILVEAPVIMILSASTALVAGPISFRRLGRFTAALNLSITVVMLLALATPAWRWLAASGIGLPARVVDLTWTALVLLLPWPAAIGYRRFFQGLLIRHQRTRRVAYGTIVRLATVTATAITLFRLADLPGAVVAAAALSAGVCVEAVASRWMARSIVASLRAQVAAAAADDDLSYGRIGRFYGPLALTSVISLAVHPLVAFSMGHARFALESLAVLPVVNSLSFVFRALGLSYQEVAIALLARERRDFPNVARFAGLLAGFGALAMALIAFTPMARVWFGGVSGLDAELVEFAILPTRILTLFPPLSVLLSFQRAILVHGRETGPITWATLIEVGGIVAALWLLIGGLDLVGATAAAIAFLSGRIAGNLFLVPPCARIARRRRS